MKPAAPVTKTLFIVEAFFLVDLETGSRVESGWSDHDRSLVLPSCTFFKSESMKKLPMEGRFCHS